MERKDEGVQGSSICINRLEDLSDVVDMAGSGKNSNVDIEELYFNYWPWRATSPHVGRHLHRRGLEVAELVC